MLSNRILEAECGRKSAPRQACACTPLSEPDFGELKRPWCFSYLFVCFAAQTSPDRRISLWGRIGSWGKIDQHPEPVEGCGSCKVAPFDHPRVLR
jgi:hypothetical protein